MPRPAHMPQLDGLRGLLFFAVAAAHWLPITAIASFPAGWMAMMTFYALSGFLITRILLRTRTQPLGQALKTFWIRRFLRVFPLYYAVIFLGLAAGAPRFVDNAPWLLTYTFNVYEFSQQHWQGAVSHLWSLAVEEQFYLLWPWVILLVPERWLPRVLGAVFFAAPVFRVTTYAVFPDLQMVGLLTPACLDALGIGAILAWMDQRDDPRIASLASVCLWLGLALFAGCTALESFAGAPKAIGRLSVTGTSLLAGWMVWRCAGGFGGVFGAWLESGWMRYLGKISYGLYIFHNLAPIATRQLIGPEAPEWQAIPVHAALTFAAAILSWHLLEGPINGLKGRWPYGSQDIVQR